MPGHSLKCHPSPLPSLWGVQGMPPWVRGWRRMTFQTTLDGTSCTFTKYWYILSVKYFLKYSYSTLLVYTLASKWQAINYLQWIEEQGSGYFSGMQLFKVTLTGAIQQVVNDHIIVINCKTSLRSAGCVF